MNTPTNSDITLQMPPPCAHTHMDQLFTAALHCPICLLEQNIALKGTLACEVEERNRLERLAEGLAQIVKGLRAPEEALQNN